MPTPVTEQFLSAERTQELINGKAPLDHTHEGGGGSNVGGILARSQFHITAWNFADYTDWQKLTGTTIALQSTGSEAALLPEIPVDISGGELHPIEEGWYSFEVRVRLAWDTTTQTAPEEVETTFYGYSAHSPVSLHVEPESYLSSGHHVATTFVTQPEWLPAYNADGDDSRYVFANVQWAGSSDDPTVNPPAIFEITMTKWASVPVAGSGPFLQHAFQASAFTYLNPTGEGSQLKANGWTEVDGFSYSDPTTYGIPSPPFLAYDSSEPDRLFCATSGWYQLRLQWFLCFPASAPTLMMAYLQSYNLDPPVITYQPVAPSRPNTFILEGNYRPYPHSTSEILTPPLYCEAGDRMATPALWWNSDDIAPTNGSSGGIPVLRVIATKLG